MGTAIAGASVTRTKNSAVNQEAFPVARRKVHLTTSRTSDLMQVRLDDQSFKQSRGFWHKFIYS